MSNDLSDMWLNIARWDWVYTDTESGRRLHHLASIESREQAAAEWRADGRASCGLRATFLIPGIMSRMGMERCRRCCDQLNWPHGEGSPKNDANLKELARNQELATVVNP